MKPIHYTSTWLFLSLALAVSMTSCTREKQYYPPIIIEKRLQKQYDRAKFEVYKLSVGVDCSCMGAVIEANKEPDTLNTLSIDIPLSKIEFNSDTISYYFKFISGHDDRLRNDFNNEISYCFEFFVIQFLEGEEHPLKAYFADTLTIVYSDNEQSGQINKIFKECLGKAKQLNPWLKAYIAKHSNL